MMNTKNLNNETGEIKDSSNNFRGNQVRQRYETIVVVITFLYIFYYQLIIKVFDILTIETKKLVFIY